MPRKLSPYFNQPLLISIRLESVYRNTAHASERTLEKGKIVGVKEIPVT